MPVTMDDLDQDFAFEIFENFQLGKELKDDVARLKLQEGQTRDMILNFIKEEILKFRSEVRTTLSEHYEYIKELHASLEKDIKNTSSEYRSMISQFRVMESDFHKFTEIRETQDAVCLQIERVKEACERMAETMRVQGDINCEVGKRLEMEKWIVKKSLDQLQSQVMIQSFSQNPIEHLAN